MHTDPASALSAPPGRLRLARRTDARVAFVRAALRGDGLRLVAQPIVDLHTGEGAADELLLRLVRADGTLAPPAPYLLAAEQYPRLMLEVDSWVLDRAAALAAMGRRLHLNLSGCTLSDPSFAERVETTLSYHGTDPRLLTFEITETAAALGHAGSCAERIAALGASIALDDFGTGYGAFSYLHRLPVSMIKIDREFVRDLATNTRSQSIVRAIVDIAGRLGHVTVAEGVEDIATLRLLRDCGVGRAQGYLLGRPRHP